MIESILALQQNMDETMAAISSQPISTKSRWIWFCVVSAVMVVLDQWMKYYAIQHWQELPPRSFLHDLFRIDYAENEGAFLGLFGNLSRTSRFWILTVFNGVILVGVSWYILFFRNVSRYVFFAFLLVVAGGFGNMLDRVRFGVVIDFFNIGIGGLRSGIFNIADMSISAGFLMMFPLVIFGETEKKAEQTPESNETSKPTEQATGPATS